MLKKLVRAAVVVLGLVVAGSASIAAAYAIWPLTVFNLLMPKDEARVLARNVAYGSNPRQLMDIYGPTEGKDLPLLVFVHGGFWNSGDKNSYDFVGHAFASKGYLTAVIQYRLVPEVQYPGFVEDTAKAVAFLSEHASDYGGNASRVYLVGHSAGAYNVVQAALNPAFSAEMKNVKAIAGMSGPYQFALSDHATLAAAFGNVAEFSETQPANFLRPGEPAILMVHGKDDDVVLPPFYRGFFDRAKTAGAEIELKVYPGTSHISILGDLSTIFRYRSPAYQDILAFFASHR